MADQYAEMTTKFNAAVNTLIDEIRVDIIKLIRDGAYSAELKEIMEADTFNPLWNFDEIVEYEVICYFIENNLTERIDSLISKNTLTRLMINFIDAQRWDIVRWYMSIHGPIADLDRIKQSGKFEKLNKMFEDNDRANIQEAIDIFGRDVVIGWCTPQIRALNFEHNINDVDSVMRAAIAYKNYALCEWLIARFNIKAADYDLDDALVELGPKSSSKF
jgi:hypothetical protein